MKSTSLAALLLSLVLTCASDFATASAAACFNLRLVQQGVVVEQRYRTVDKAGGGRMFMDSTQTVVGRKKFKGKNALMTSAENSSRQRRVDTVVQTDNYILVQNGKKRVRTLGGTGHTFVDGVDRGKAEITYQPALLFRYDLRPGQQYKQTVTLKTRSSNKQGSATQSIKQTITRKYIGRENIKVPLGRRNTCKFKVTTTQRQFFIRTKTVSTEWYDVKSGMLIKEVSGGSTTVLVRASIDGVKI